ncbi:MAG: cache domain-containing protein [Spirochaetes bacterium]|nr:cache domain-containing protein [Spirochaetota bacterium]
MKLSWKNISLGYKIFGVLLVTVLIFAATIILYILPTLEDKIVSERKESLKNMVAIAIGYCNSINAEYEQGTVTKEEMERRITSRLRSMKYGPENKDYLFISDLSPMMIMHPFNAGLEGKDLGDYKDPTGKKLFVEMATVCKEKGAGFVEYRWQYKDDKNRIVPKITYVQLFKPLGYVIGTGLYIEDVRESIRSLTIGIIVIMLVITAVIGGIIILLTRSIVKPVQRIIRYAGSLADGDFTWRLEDDDRKDEMGKIAAALNTAADGLEELITGVVESSENLVQAVGQISSGNQNLSQRTSEQASSIEEIASTIEETAATINQNAENAVRASSLTDQGVSKSMEGNRIAIEAVASITEMNESSKKVADIIAVINEIAFQTNLLALNAAVEAARAGEQGRGFAVVAGEVRNLAQRSGNAAKEIESLIRDTVAKVESSTELVNRTGNSLTEIAEAAKVSARIIGEITAASQEQKQGINQINTAISEMDTMTQQNASLVEETASASEEMSNQAQELLGMVQKFKVRTAMAVKSGRKSAETRQAAAKQARKETAKPQPAGNVSKKDSSERAATMTAARAAHDSHMKKIMKQDGFEEF